MTSNKEQKENILEEACLKSAKKSNEPIEDEVNFNEISTIAKITHKSLKARILGLQTIIAELSKSHTINDNEVKNHICLNADILFSENSPESQKLVMNLYSMAFFEKKWKNEICEFNKKSFWYNFIDKFFCSSKTNIKELAVKFFTELSKIIDFDKFGDICIEFLGKSNVKLNCAILGILVSEFERFGNWSSKLAVLAPVIDKLVLNPHTDIKSNLKIFMKKILAAGYGELISLLKNVKPQYIDEVMPAIQQKIQSSQTNLEDTNNIFSGKIAKLMRNNSQQIDLYKNAEPVSIMSKFTEVWIENVKSIKKWNEKQEAIEAFLKAANVAKLNSAENYNSILLLAKILLDNSNIHIQICGMKIFGALAKGLRLNARQYVKSNFNLLVAKLKDRKAIILEALHAAIKNIFFCLTVEEIYEEVKIFNIERNRDIRLNILVLAKNLFCFLIETKDMSKNIPIFIRMFKEMLNAYYDDPDIEVRKLNNELVLFIQELLEDDEPNLNLFNEQIDQKRVKPRSNPADSKLIQLKQSISFQEKSSKMEIEEKVTQNKETSSKKTTVDKKKPVNLENRNTKELKTYVYKICDLSDTDIVNNLREIFTDEIISLLSNAAWKAKSEGLKKLKEYMEVMSPLQIDIRFTKSVFGFLKKEFKGYKESNVICIKQIFDCFATAVGRIDFLDDLCYEFCCLLIRKVAEPKFQTQINEIMSLFLKKMTLFKILHIIVLYQDMFTNPKTLSDIFVLISGFTDKNTVFFPQDLKTFLLLGLNNSNQSTRKSAIDFFVKAGPSLTDEAVLSILSEVENSNLSKSLETMIIPLTSKIDKKGEPNEKDKTKTDGPIPAAGENRQSTVTIGDMLTGLTKQDWKVRKEAIENYLGYLEHNPHHFSVLNVHETFQNINLRLHDSQRLIALVTLTKFKAIVQIYFNQLKPYHKLIVENMLEFLIDKNVY